MNLVSVGKGFWAFCGKVQVSPSRLSLRVAEKLLYHVFVTSNQNMVPNRKHITTRSRNSDNIVQAINLPFVCPLPLSCAMETCFFVRAGSIRRRLPSPLPLNAAARQELLQRFLPDGDLGREGRGDSQAGTSVLGGLLEPLPERLWATESLTFGLKALVTNKSRSSFSSKLSSRCVLHPSRTIQAWGNLSTG